MQEPLKNVEKLIPADLKGRYRDFEFVGQGGMGRIVSAHDTMLDKRVAIKLLPIISFSDTALVRFHQEAKAVSKLNHINIVKVYDFGFTSTEEPYLVMDYIAGAPLDSIIELNKTIPLRNAIQIGIKICDALEHAHFNGVIHRDLKPSNVMIDENNEVKILDFGLAKLMDQADIDRRITRRGQAMGSPLYMSPEQVRGEDADERADVFGLGMLIYKMVAGVVPNENENVINVLRARLEEAPPALPENPDAPVLTDALNEILEKSLAVKPADRFQTMTEFKAALEGLSDVGEKFEEIELKLPEPRVRIEKHEIRAGIVVLIVVVLLCGVGFETWSEYTKFVEKFNREKPKLVPRPTSKTKIKPPDEIPPGFEKIETQNADFWEGKTVRDDELNRLFGTNVKNLSLSWNRKITVEGIKTLAELKQIERLSIGETRLGDECIPYLNQMDLKALDIRGSRITNAGIRQLRPSDTLTYLEVNYLKHFDDETLKEVVKKFPKLRNVKVGNTKVTPNGLKVMKKLPLYQLSVSVLKLTDKDMDVLAYLNPGAIDLEGNPITYKGLQKLKKLKKLDWIGLDYTEITQEQADDLARHFPGMTYSLLKPEKEELDEAMKNLYNEPDLK